MKQPVFSIMLPAKGRPHLICDALMSLLRQDFADFEILFSNNGADPQIREAVAHLLNDSRLRYFEQPQVLNMPTHWETVSRLASGRYFLVVTDRSVLKQGALRKVNDAHGAFNGADIVSWPWDLYFDQYRLLVPYVGDAKVTALPADDLLRSSFGHAEKYPYALPRGLNSSIAVSLLSEMRAVSGTAFDRINPDFTCAYRSLMLRKQCVYIDEALMISQGLNVSNGGNALRGDARTYFSTLGEDLEFECAPVKAVLCENGIMEDLLQTCRLFGRFDLIDEWDRTAYYVKCLSEVEEKRHAGIVDRNVVERLDESVHAALAREPKEVQKAVLASMSSRPRHGAFRKHVQTVLGAALTDVLRPFLLKYRGAVRTSVLQAAGFEALP